MSTMGINPQTGFAEATGRSARFTKWAAFLIFSMITLGSSVQVKRSIETYDMPAASTVYTVACSSITFVATLLAVVSHFHPVTATMFVGTVVEGVTVIVLVIFWTAIVSIISDATNGLIGLEDASQTVQNANLYYSSWAGFITSILIAVDYARTAFGVDAAAALRGTAKRLDLWAGLLCFTIVVMGSCARTIKTNCREDNYRFFPDGYCQRTKFGVAAGVFGVVASLTMIYLKVKAGGAPFLTEAYVSIFLFIVDTVAVALLTAASGPGSAIGNLYYFSWASFIMSAYIVFSCYGEWSGHDESADPTIPNPNTSEQPNIEAHTNGDIEVETFDDSKI